MKTLITLFVLIHSFGTMAAANKVDILNCSTEFYSVNVGLIDDQNTLEVIVSSDSGDGGSTSEVYRSDWKESHKDALEAGDGWAFAAQKETEGTIDSVIIINDENQYKVSMNGFLQTLPGCMN